MGLNKDIIDFNTADDAGSDSIGAYLIASDGTLLTHTGGALNVSDGGGSITVDGSLTVSATDLDIRDLSHVSDSIKVGDGTDFLAIAADGSIAVTDNGATLSVDDGAGSLTVDAINLDIRDLSASSDFVAISDGTDTLQVNADGSLNVNLTDDGIAHGAADAGNPFKVGSRSVDQASALVAVDANDRSDLLSDLYSRIWMTNAANIGILAQSVAVDNTVGGTLLPIVEKPGRQLLLVQNLSVSEELYIGGVGVTVAAGFQIPKRSSIELAIAEGVAVYGITGSASASDVRVLEVA